MQRILAMFCGVLLSFSAAQGALAAGYGSFDISNQVKGNQNNQNNQNTQNSGRAQKQEGYATPPASGNSTTRGRQAFSGPSLPNQGAGQGQGQNQQLGPTAPAGPVAPTLPTMPAMPPGGDPVRHASQLYQHGRTDEARAVLEAAAQKNDERAYFGLGLMAARGENKAKKPDYKDAEKWWKQSAASGNPEAQFQLGMLYSGKFLGAPNMEEARDYWTQAANKGHGDAMYCLGRMYNTGDGVGKDLPQSASWYEKAARLGHPDAQYQYALMLSKGEGVPQDVNKAREWLQKAQQAQHPKAKKALEDLGK